VADIDRGGVFAAVIGTYALLDDEARGLLRGFAVNRFRGDATLFADGVEILETRTARPCVGVFPMAPEIDLDPEDGVSIEDLPHQPGRPVAIVRLPRISNFTDFRLLGSQARWITRPVAERFECIILPGTKNTIGDLEWLRATGLDEWILEQSREGAQVIGICGGYQMMGESVADPHGVEAGAAEVQGLGLLPVRTVMRKQKTVRPVEAVTPSGVSFTAYEIHMGETVRPPHASPFALLSDGTGEGVRCGRHAGTYLHGALESAPVLSELLGREFQPAPSKQENYARLAEWFERSQRGFAEIYL
jgi:adenosylcobyric acid synthase